MTDEASPAKNYSIRAIPVAAIPRFWPFAVPYIKRALDRTPGELSIEDYHRFALNAQIQLWLVHDGTRVCGAVTTEIVKFPKVNRMRILTMGGNDFDLWGNELDVKMREWALTNKCDGIEAYVRKGFVQKLRSAGYYHKLSMVWRPINKGPPVKET